jgi:uncharacterized protein (DUF305 family)
MAWCRVNPLASPILVVLLLVGCAGAGRRVDPAPAPRVSRYPTTEADVRFMTDMIGHHGQAVLMAGWVPGRAASPAVRRLAERILAGQRDEIATMRQWLQDRGRTSPDPHHAGHGHRMAGMLTDAQLEQLQAARGPDFDRLFLTFMIQHHRGAVSMVKTLFGTPGAAQDETVFKFANDVNVDQTTEIARMERMLSALSADEPAS